ncbi:MAG: hypothetical protein JKX81_11275 [Arenicella sp.]|nr:hypothetical protein [Arenicella sp.]
MIRGFLKVGGKTIFIALFLNLIGCSIGHTAIEEESSVQVGVRPFYLVSKMTDGNLKRKLESCAAGPFYKTDFSLGHRGAPLQFPEHTKESYTAAALQGAGLIECDVAFTKDAELVCRHSQCDLHTTTNILETDLASSCIQPFSAAKFDLTTGKRTQAASAKCCTNDITLSEFKSLCGKMDASNIDATTASEFQGSPPAFRTELYDSCGTVMSHKESIKLIKDFGIKFVPELKEPDPQITMPFDTDGDGVGDYTKQQYAQQIVNEYIQADVPPEQVWLQSFDLDDIHYWIDKNPKFGRRAVFLDSRPYDDLAFQPTLSDFTQMKSIGVQIIAPPIQALLKVDVDDKIVPSEYAILAKKAGLDIVAWTVERSGRIVEDVKNNQDDQFYYKSVSKALESDGDIMKVIDVLAQDVGVIGVFSDWPATVTYYANCMQLDNNNK